MRHPALAVPTALLLVTAAAGQPVDWSGVVTVNPGSTLTAAGPVVLGDGSRVYVGTAAHHGGLVALGSTLAVNGGLLVNNGTVGGTTYVNAGGLVKGSGTFGPVHVTAGGRVAPGNSPGGVTTGDGTTWGAGGSYQWEVNDATGTPGGPAGWDTWHIAGTLNVTAGMTANTRFTIEIVGLTGGNAPGLPDNFVSTQSYQWPIATAATDISGFDSNKFAVDASQFSAPGSFSLDRVGNAIVLTFTPVPEPGCAVAVLAGGAALAGWWRRTTRRGF